MASPHISFQEAARRVGAVNDCLSRGFRPPGFPGKGPGALTQAAIDLGLNRNSTTMRVFEIIKAVYGLEPDWGRYKLPEPPRLVPLGQPQRVVEPAPIEVPPPPEPTLLERLKKGAVSQGFTHDEIEMLRRQGHNVHERAGVLTLEKDVQPAFIGGPVFEYVSRPDNTFLFGATSDNHLCFPPNTRVETEAGPKRISAVKVGDKVLTHRGRYRPVTKVVVSKSDGTFSRLSFRGGSVGGSDAYASLVCTPNHPVLVTRNGATGFLPALEVRPGDAVRYLSQTCKFDGCETLVPVGFSVCKDHDPFVRPLSDAAKKQRYEAQAKARVSPHFVNDIAPTMEAWVAQGWRVVPVDKVRPDFIAVRNGEIVAVEVEAPASKIRPRPMTEKYEWSDCAKYYDRVEWVEIDRREKKVNRKYDWLEADEYGFVGMVVSSVAVFKSRPTKVYNLIVDEDETYVAKRCVVHNCSKYERLDVLNSLYDTFVEEGADRVFNAGNWIDGEARFNKFDLHTHGMDNQLAYLAAEYPKRKGLVTYAVAGDDHEGWYGQREGVDIGKYAEHVMQQAGRSDWVNLGYMEAHVKLVNANTGKWSMLAVVHPGGGSAYAVSYSIQKIIESLDGGEKPAVGLYGHYHKLWAGNIRNVWVAQTGTTEDQTPFMRKKKLEAHVGGLLIKLTQDPETGAITRFAPEILRFFNRGFYNHRWSHGSDPIMPHRSVS